MDSNLKETIQIEHLKRIYRSHSNTTRHCEEIQLVGKWIARLRDPERKDKGW